MFNYKKSLVSMAAATALAMVPLSANYIPLSDSNDQSVWTLFGVTGLKTTGAGAGTAAGTFSIADSTANSAKDLTLDDLFTEGMTVNGHSLGKVKVLNPYTTVQVRVDTTGAVYNETEPVRTMYVKMNKNDTGPSFAFTYRASLEGQKMQYSTNADGSNAHEVVINSANTYNNPAYGEVIQEVAGLPGSSLSKLSDAVDYDFSNNPIDSSYYDKATDQDKATTGEYLRVYSYNAATKAWELYDSRNTNEANDFSELVKGKAYWAKMNNGTSNKVGGLVLGSSSISAAEYATAGLSAGWNLMAFDKENPDIRKSNTGLILTIDGSNSITIYDASGNHSITAAIDNTSATTVNASCKAINNALKTAKAQGSMPKIFDLRAFEIDATHIVLVSNQRFMVSDAGAISGVTTLTGANPYSVTNPANPINGDDTNAITALTTTPVAMSKYGEYALVINPIYAAQALGAAKIHLQSAASDASSVNPVAEGANLAATATALGINIGGDTAVVNQIDINADDTTDRLLIAAKKPFYIRDYTFARVFKYKVDTTAGTTYIRGTGTDADIAIASATADANAYAALITGNGGVVADDDGGANVVIITDATNANEFTVSEATTADQIEDATTTSDLAKGAVTGVYSLDALSSMALSNTLVGTGAGAGNGLALMNHATDTVQVSVTTLYGTFTDTATALGTTNAASQAAYSAAVKAQIEALLSAKNIAYTSVTVSSADPAVVTIVSKEVTDFTITATDVDGTGNGTDTSKPTAANTSKGNPVTISPDLADDLKFNAIYTPNYVVNGPLYTMAEDGFTLGALVTGSTDLSDGSVNWDSVDLTRTPSEWLNSQDYNLFRIDETSGYWAYLDANTTTNALAVSNATIKPLTYTYRFNKKNTAGTEATNYNSVSGNIALTVDGLDKDSRAVPVVTATVAGSKVELANVAGSNIYTGKISSYELKNMTAGYEYEILANVADGLGQHLISKNVGLKVDLQKPNLPTIDLTDPTAVKFTSTSTDVAGYYVFNGQIPEMNTDTASTLLAKLTATEAAAYGLCGNVDALAWNKPAYELNVVAVDGAGTLGKGNVSDTAIKSYVPMLQNSVLVTNVNQGTGNITTSTVADGTTHDAKCANTGVQSVDYGVSISSISDYVTAKLAYTPQNLADGFGAIITLYVTGSANAGSKIVEINYATAYAGKKVYVDIGGAVYSLILPTQAEIDGATYTGANEGATDTNPLDLDDTTLAPNNVKATYYKGQSL